MKGYRLAGGEALAKAVEIEYTKGLQDYHLKPLNLLDKDGKAVGTVKADDGVIFCCRRGEREVELTDAFTDPVFKGFERKQITPLDFVILTMYNEKYTYLPIAFAPDKVQNTLAQTLSEAGKTQLHLAESEKYAHVTFFFNGGNQTPFKGEDDIKVPSPKGVPFDQVPELSLPKVAQTLCEGIDKGYDFIVTNFANGDVIGHTTNDDAKRKATPAVDKYVKMAIEHATKAGYRVLLTADHGNIEILRKPDGSPHVAHTSNLVACIGIGEGMHLVHRDGKLCDVAPTVLKAMGLKQPKDMTGSSLFDFDGTSKVLLLILDGWGLGEHNANNPIYSESTPYWDWLLDNKEYAQLQASGPAVGLEDGKPGNSEAGHINLGSGRVVLQDDVRLEKAMTDGSFAQNKVFIETIENCKKKGSSLHLLSLLTKKSSHGSIDYPLAILDIAKRYGLDDVYVHIIFDGRSTDPGSAPAMLRELGQTLEEKKVGLIVSGVGRGVALDRDLNWAKVQSAYDSLVSGTGIAYKEC